MNKIGDSGIRLLVAVVLAIELVPSILILSFMLATASVGAEQRRASASWLVFGTATSGGLVQSSQAIRYESPLICRDALAKIQLRLTDPTFYLTVPPYCTSRVPGWWVE